MHVRTWAVYATVPLAIGFLAVAAFAETPDDQSTLTADQVKHLRSIALAANESPASRAGAIRTLTKNSSSPGAQDAAVEALAVVVSAEKPDPTLSAALKEFTCELRDSKSIPYFAKIAESAAAPKRELAYTVLVNLATGATVKPDIKAAAAMVIDRGWSKPAWSVSLLRAIGRARAAGYNDWIEAMLTDPNPDVVRAAVFAADQLNLKLKLPVIPEGKADIKALGFDKTVAIALKEKGDSKIGAELFTRLGCVVCHTVSPDQPAKGPFLGGISTRANRAELCESIMKPSAKIAQGFETQFFKMKDGDLLEGFVTREAGDEIEIRNVAGITAVLDKKNIKSRGKRDISVMPEGLVEKLTPQELANLLAYLESLKGK
jgi:putative heme-binding domain-containing protein